MSIERKRYAATGWKSWVERRQVNTASGMILSYVRLVKIESDAREVTISELAQREGITPACLIYRITHNMPMPALLSQKRRLINHLMVEVAWAVHQIYKKIQRDGVVSRAETMAICEGNNNRHISILKNLKICFSQFKTYKYGPAVVYFFDEDHPAVAAAIHAIKNKPSKRELLRIKNAAYSQSERIAACRAGAQLMLDKLDEKGWFSRAEIVESLGIETPRWKSLLMKLRTICDVASISTGQKTGGWIYYVPGDKRYVAELDRLAARQRRECQKKSVKSVNKKRQLRSHPEKPLVITDQLRQSTMDMARQATAKKDPVKSWLYGSALRA